MSDELETVEGLGDEEPEAPTQVPRKPSQAAVPNSTQKLYSNPNRNLTNEAIIANLEARRDEELSKIPEDEGVKCLLPKLDKNGKKVVDGNGFTVTEERTVLKRDKVAADWNKRIETVRDGLQG